VDWVKLLTKTGEMVSLKYDRSEDVAALAVPKMLVFADADGINPGHMVAFYKKLSGGRRDAGLDGSLRPTAQLAVLPNTTHYDIMNSAQVARSPCPSWTTACRWNPEPSSTRPTKRNAHGIYRTASGSSTEQVA
jgi:hypothetical protein